MEAAYRLERSVVVTDDGRSRKPCYTIYRSGDGELCYGEDAVFMHRIVDLLNEEHTSTSPNR